jgi:hypothetical protein
MPRDMRLCVMRVHLCGFRRFQALLRVSVVRFDSQSNPRLNLSSYPHNPRYSLPGLLTIGRNNNAEGKWLKLDGVTPVLDSALH